MPYNSNYSLIVRDKGLYLSNNNLIFTLYMQQSFKKFFSPLTVLLIAMGCLLLVRPAAAQNTGSINFETLQSSNVSEQQLRQLWERAQERGYSLQELERIAVIRGMDPAEASKLVSRIRDLEPLNASQDTNPRFSEGRQITQDSLLTEPPDLEEDEQPKSRIFGAALFSNREEISFSPPMNIPTPASYQLGTGD